MGDARAQLPITIIQAVYKEVGADYWVKPHASEDYEWYGVLYGRVEMTVDREPFLLESGKSALIPPKTSHSTRCKGKPPGYFYVTFRNHALDLHAIERRLLVMPAELLPDLRTLVAELRRVPDQNTQALIDALVVRLLVGLQRRAPEASESDRAASSPLNASYHGEIVRRVQEFMRRNLHRRLTRQSLAEAAHLSPPHLARIFHAVTGETILEQLMELRVARTKELLLSSTMSITEIALEVGYDSFSHFSKVFRTATGVSPSDYRRSGGHVYREQ
jgi:AraC-like DNA-binding protein